MVKPQLSELHEQAMSLHKQGYNCAQCVSMVFDPSLGVVTSGLGRGVGGTGHICGAASAMAIVVGARSFTSPSDKPAINAEVKGLIDDFACMNNGLCDCRDLRKPGAKPCNQLIKDAITLLYNHYYGEEN